MGKREEERRRTDRDFEEIRSSVAAQSDEWLCNSLREVPRRRWINIMKDWRLAIGIIAHRAATRIEELEKEAAIADVVWKFIDRMGDIDPQYDPAEKILNEFYSAVHPAIEAALPKRPL